MPKSVDNFRKVVATGSKIETKSKPKENPRYTGIYPNDDDLVVRYPNQLNGNEYDDGSDRLYKRYYDIVAFSRGDAASANPEKIVLFNGQDSRQNFGQFDVNALIDHLKIKIYQDSRQKKNIDKSVVEKSTRYFSEVTSENIVNKSSSTFSQDINESGPEIKYGSSELFTGTPPVVDSRSPINNLKFSYGVSHIDLSPNGQISPAKIIQGQILDILSSESFSDSVKITQIIELFNEDEQDDLIKLLFANVIKKYINRDSNNPQEYTLKATPFHICHLLKLEFGLILDQVNAIQNYCITFPAEETVKSYEEKQLGTRVKKFKEGISSVINSYNSQILKKRGELEELEEGLYLADLNQTKTDIDKLNFAQRHPSSRKFKSKILTPDEQQEVFGSNILSSDQVSLLMQVEEVLIKGGSSHSKIRGLLDNRMGKTFLSNIITKYQNILRRSDRNQDEIELLKLVNVGHIEILNINLANSEQLEELESQPNLNGKLIIVDEDYFIPISQKDLRKLVSKGAKVVRFGASENLFTVTGEYYRAADKDEISAQIAENHERIRSAEKLKQKYQDVLDTIYKIRRTFLMTSSTGNTMIIDSFDYREFEKEIKFLHGSGLLDAQENYLKQQLNIIKDFEGRVNRSEASNQKYEKVIFELISRIQFRFEDSGAVISSQELVSRLGLGSSGKKNRHTSELVLDDLFTQGSVDTIKEKIETESSKISSLKNKNDELIERNRFAIERINQHRRNIETIKQRRDEAAQRIRESNFELTEDFVNFSDYKDIVLAVSSNLAEDGEKAQHIFPSAKFDGGTVSAFQAIEGKTFVLNTVENRRHKVILVNNGQSTTFDLIDQKHEYEEAIKDLTTVNELFDINFAIGGDFGKISVLNEGETQNIYLDSNSQPSTNYEKSVLREENLDLFKQMFGRDRGDGYRIKRKIFLCGDRSKDPQKIGKYLIGSGFGTAEYRREFAEVMRRQSQENDLRQRLTDLEKKLSKYFLDNEGKSLQSFFHELAQETEFENASSETKNLTPEQNLIRLIFDKKALEDKVESISGSLRDNIISGSLRDNIKVEKFKRDLRSFYLYKLISLGFDKFSDEQTEIKNLEGKTIDNGAIKNLGNKRSNYHIKSSLFTMLNGFNDFCDEDDKLKRYFDISAPNSEYYLNKALTPSQLRDLQFIFLDRVDDLERMIRSSEVTLKNEYRTIDNSEDEVRKRDEENSNDRKIDHASQTRPNNAPSSTSQILGVNQTAKQRNDQFNLPVITQLKTGSTSGVQKKTSSPVSFPPINDSSNKSSRANGKNNSIPTSNLGMPNESSSLHDPNDYVTWGELIEEFKKFEERQSVLRLSLQEDLKRLQGKMNNQNTPIDQIKSSIESINKRIKQNEDHYNKLYSFVDVQMKSINDEMSSLIAQQNQFNIYAQGFRTKLDALNQNDSKQKQRIEAVEAGQLDLNGRYKKFKEAVKQEVEKLIKQSSEAQAVNDNKYLDFERWMQSQFDQIGFDQGRWLEQNLQIVYAKFEDLTRSVEDRFVEQSDFIQKYQYIFERISEVEQGLAQVNARFDRVDERFDKMEGQIGDQISTQMKAQFESYQRLSNEANQKSKGEVQQIVTNSELKTNTRLNSLDSGLAAMREALASNNGEILSVANAFTEFQKSLLSYNLRLGELEDWRTKFAAEIDLKIQSEAKERSAAIDALKKDQEGQKVRVDTISNQQTTQQKTLESVVSSQTKQQQTLESVESSQTKQQQTLNQQSQDISQLSVQITELLKRISEAEQYLQKELEAKEEIQAEKPEAEKKSLAELSDGDEAGFEEEKTGSKQLEEKLFETAHQQANSEALVEMKAQLEQLQSQLQKQLGEIEELKKNPDQISEKLTQFNEKISQQLSQFSTNLADGLKSIEESSQGLDEKFSELKGGLEVLISGLIAAQLMQNLHNYPTREQLTEALKDHLTQEQIEKILANHNIELARQIDEKIAAKSAVTDEQLKNLQTSHQTISEEQASLRQIVQPLNQAVQSLQTSLDEANRVKADQISELVQKIENLKRELEEKLAAEEAAKKVAEARLIEVQQAREKEKTARKDEENRSAQESAKAASAAVAANQLAEQLNSKIEQERAAREAAFAAEKTAREDQINALKEKISVLEQAKTRHEEQLDEIQQINQSVTQIQTELGSLKERQTQMNSDLSEIPGSISQKVAELEQKLTDPNSEFVKKLSGQISNPLLQQFAEFRNQISGLATKEELQVVADAQASQKEEQERSKAEQENQKQQIKDLSTRFNSLVTKEELLEELQKLVLVQNGSSNLGEEKMKGLIIKIDELNKEIEQLRNQVTSLLTERNQTTLPTGSGRRLNDNRRRRVSFDGEDNFNGWQDFPYFNFDIPYTPSDAAFDQRPDLNPVRSSKASGRSSGASGRSDDSTQTENRYENLLQKVFERLEGVIKNDVSNQEDEKNNKLLNINKIMRALSKIYAISQNDGVEEMNPENFSKYWKGGVVESGDRSHNLTLTKGDRAVLSALCLSDDDLRQVFRDKTNLKKFTQSKVSDEMMEDICAVSTMLIREMEENREKFFEKYRFEILDGKSLFGKKSEIDSFVAVKKESKPQNHISVEYISNSVAEARGIRLKLIDPKSRVN